jgi:hypothetical protein
MYLWWGSMIMIKKRYRIPDLVKERWSCGCIAGEKDMLC